MPGELGGNCETLRDGFAGAWRTRRAQQCETSRDGLAGCLANLAEIAKRREMHLPGSREHGRASGAQRSGLFYRARVEDAVGSSRRDEQLTLLRAFSDAPCQIKTPVKHYMNHSHSPTIAMFGNEYIRYS